MIARYILRVRPLETSFKKPVQQNTVIKFTMVTFKGNLITAMWKPHQKEYIFRDGKWNEWQITDYERAALHKFARNERLSENDINVIIRSQNVTLREKVQLMLTQNFVEYQQHYVQMLIHEEENPLMLEMVIQCISNNYDIPEAKIGLPLKHRLLPSKAPRLSKKDVLLYIPKEFRFGRKRYMRVKNFENKTADDLATEIQNIVSQTEPTQSPFSNGFDIDIVANLIKNKLGDILAEKFGIDVSAFTTALYMQLALDLYNISMSVANIATNRNSKVMLSLNICNLILNLIALAGHIYLYTKVAWNARSTTDFITLCVNEIMSGFLGEEKSSKTLKPTEIIDEIKSQTGETTLTPINENRPQEESHSKEFQSLTKELSVIHVLVTQSKTKKLFFHEVESIRTNLEVISKAVEKLVEKERNVLRNQLIATRLALQHADLQRPHSHVKDMKFASPLWNLVYNEGILVAKLAMQTDMDKVPAMVEQMIENYKSGKTINVDKQQHLCGIFVFRTAEIVEPSLISCFSTLFECIVKYKKIEDRDYQLYHDWLSPAALANVEKCRNKNNVVHDPIDIVARFQQLENEVKILEELYNSLDPKSLDYYSSLIDNKNKIQLIEQQLSEEVFISPDMDIERLVDDLLDRVALHKNALAGALEMSETDFMTCLGKYRPATHFRRNFFGPVDKMNTLLPRFIKFLKGRAYQLIIDNACWDELDKVVCEYCNVSNQYFIEHGRNPRVRRMNQHCLDLIAACENLRKDIANPTLGEIAFHMKYSPVKQSGHIELALKMLVGVVALGISVTDVTQGTNFGKNIVHGNTLKKAINDNVRDGQELVQSIAYDCFGVKMSKTLCLVDEINEVIAKLDGLCAHEVCYFSSDVQKYYELRDTIEACTKSLTSYNSKDVPQSLSAVTTMAMQSLNRAKLHYQKCTAALEAMGNRVETKCYHIIGLHGAGKSTFTSKYLIPHIAKEMGWPITPYVINFGGQIFFPPYAGQPIGLYDELFQKKSEDPMLAEFTKICSSVYCNMPGAALEYKTQPCALKALFCISNKQWVNIKDKYDSTGEDAIYSRLQRFVFINCKQQDPAREARKDIAYDPNFGNENIEIRRYKYAAKAKTEVPDFTPTKPGTDTTKGNDPYDLITKEEFVKIVCDDIRAQQELYNEQQQKANQIAEEIKKAAKKPTKEEDEKAIPQALVEDEDDFYDADDMIPDSTNHYTVLVCGQPGMGKTSSFKKVASYLAKATKLPVVEVNALPTKPIRVPSIVLTNDTLVNEKNYVEFYDSLPVPSIIINTCNMKLGTVRCGITDSEHGEDKAGWINWITKKLVQLRSWYNTAHKVIKYNTECPEPGFARRIGIRGYVKHEGQLAYTSPEIADTYVMVPGHKIMDYYTRKEMLPKHIGFHIFTRYAQMTRNELSVTFKKVEGNWSIDEPSYDCEVYAESVEELADTVNNPHLCMAAWNRGLHSDPIRPYIRISDRTRNSTFMFDPTMFYINEDRSIDSVKQMASTSFATLKESNSSHTCLISARDFIARCKGNVIEWQLGENYMHHLTYYSHVINRNSEGVPVINIYRSQASAPEEEPEHVVTYSIDQVIRGYVFGFQRSNVTIEDNDVLEYLIKHKDRIRNDSMVIPVVRRTEIVRVNAENISDEELIHFSWWANFIKSPIGIMICLLMTIVSLTVIITLFVGIIQWFCSNHEMPTEEASEKVTQKQLNIPKKFPTEIMGARGNVYKIKYESKKSFIFDIILEIDTIDEMEGDMIKDTIQAKMHEVDKRYTIGKFGILVYESDYTNDPKYSRGGHKRAVTATRRVDTVKNISTVAQALPRTIETSTPTTTPMQSAIYTKIQNNMAWITATRGSCYAMFIKGKYLMTSAHIFADADILASVKTANGTFNAQLQFIDRGNETAICYIKDQRCPQAADLTKYFITDLLVDHVTAGALMRVHKEDTSKCDFINGSVLNYDFKEPRRMGNGVVVSNYWYTKFFGLNGVKTGLGDCGSPLVSTDKCVSEKMILGLHFAKGVDNSTRSSCVTQEYIKTIFDKLKNEQHMADDDILVIESQKIEQDNDIDLGLPFKLDVPLIADKFTSEWITNLEPVKDSEENKQFCNISPNDTARNIYAIGYDPTGAFVKAKHLYAKTPYIDSIVAAGLPIEKKPSCLNIREVRDPSNLVSFNGKKSILKSQITLFNEDKILSDLARQKLEIIKVGLANKYKQLYNAKHRTLHESEVLNGTYFNSQEKDFYTNLDRMDLDSSSGWYAQKKYGIMNKRPLFKVHGSTVFNRDVYTWADTKAAQDVKNKCHDVVEAAAGLGQRYLCITKDNIKSELLKLEKVERGRSRAFQSMCISEVYLIRKYLGTLMAMFKKRQPVANCQVGIDPIPGMNQLVEHLRRHSHLGFAGDYKNYDKFLVAELISAALFIMEEITTQHIKDPIVREQWSNVFKVIKSIIINTISICEGIVYIKTRGNPSGNVLTTILNSIINDLYTYTVALILIEKHNSLIPLGLNDDSPLGEFYKDEMAMGIVPVTTPLQGTFEFVDKQLRLKDYGDDIVVAVKEAYVCLFNFAKYKEVFQEHFKLDFDTPSKDGKTFHVKKITDLEFLSRVFKVPSGESVVFPALKTSTIVSLLHYSTNFTTDQTLMNFRMVIDEASLHEESFFNLCCRAISTALKYLEETEGRYIEYFLPSYQEARTKVRNIILYGRSPYMFESYMERPQTNGLESVSNSIFSGKDLERMFSLTDMATEIQSLPNVHDDNKDFAPISRADALLRCLQFSGTHINGYWPTVAINRRDSRKSWFSACFSTLRCYSTHDFPIIRKEIQTAFNRIKEPVNIGDIAIVVRNLGKEIKRENVKPIYQVLLEITSIPIKSQEDIDFAMKNGKDKMIKRQVKFTLHDKTENTEIQATGTQEVPMLYDENHMIGDDMSVQPVAVPPEMIKLGMFSRDMKELSYRSMQVEIIDVPVDSAPESLIKTITYADTTNWSKAMKRYGKLHSRISGPIIHTFLLFAPSTVISSLIIGVSNEKKAAYSIQELQMLEWKGTMGTEGCWTIDVSLAATEDNKLPLWTEIVDSTENGVLRPTIVIMTRIRLQNSYANDKVSLQLIHNAHFSNKTQLVAIPDDINEKTEGGNDGSLYRGNRATLHDLLKLPKERHLHITLDGDVVSDQPDTYTAASVLDKELPSLDPRIETGAFGVKPIAQVNVEMMGRILNRGGAESFVKVENTFITADVPTVLYNSVGVRAIKAFTPAGSPVKAPPNAGAGIHVMLHNFLISKASFVVATSLNNKAYPALSSLYLKTIDAAKVGTSDVLEAVTEIQQGIPYNSVCYRLAESNFGVYKPTEFEPIEAWRKDQNGNVIDGYMYTRVKAPEPDFEKPIIEDIHLIMVDHPTGLDCIVVASYWGAVVTGTQPDSAFIKEYQSMSMAFMEPEVKESAPAEKNFLANALHRIAVNFRREFLGEYPTILASTTTRGNETLHPAYAAVKFSRQIPPSVPMTLAKSGTGTIFNDSVVVTALNRFLALSYGTANTRFAISFGSKNVPQTLFTMAWDTETGNGMVYLADVVEAKDKFKAVPKLVFEDVYVNSIRVLSGNAGIAATSVRGWVDRTFTTKQARKFYNGESMVSSLGLRNDVGKRMITLTPREMQEYAEPQAAIAASMLGGGLLAGLGSGMSSWANVKTQREMQRERLEFFREQLLMQLEHATGQQKERLTARLELLEKKLAHAEEMQEGQFAQEREMANLKADLQLRNAGISTPQNVRAGIGSPQTADPRYEDNVRNFIYSQQFVPSSRQTLQNEIRNLDEDQKSIGSEYSSATTVPIEDIPAPTPAHIPREPAIIEEATLPEETEVQAVNPNVNMPVPGIPDNMPINRQEFVPNTGKTTQQRITNLRNSHGLGVEPGTKLKNVRFPALT